MITTLDIPQEWQKIRLKRIAYLNPSKSEVANLPGDTEVTFLPMEVVSESWEVDYSRTRPLEEVRNGYTYFSDGDILIAKITPCFENGKGALVNGCLNGFGFGTTEFHVIRSPNLETTRFLSYVVRSHRFKVEGAGMMTGTAGQKRLSDDYIKDFEVFLPSLPKQESIARFLDHKTAAIDSLIAKKQRLIQLLEEKRTALINRIVTKGLNSNALMKDSGIPWIGEIPERWKVKRIGYISRVFRGASPRPAGDPMYFDGDAYPWITVGEITKDQNMYLTSTETFLTKLGREQSRLIPEGTLLLTNSGATLGVPKITLINGCINDGSVALFDISKQVEKEFIYFVFISMTNLLRDRLYQGSGQPNLNTDLVKAI